MRSSVEEFLVFCNQLRQRSALISLGCCAGKVQWLQVVGRIVSVNSERLIVRGRSSEVELSLRRAVFERNTLSESKVVEFTPDDPKRSIRPDWEIRWGKRSFVLFGERLLSDKERMGL